MGYVVSLSLSSLIISPRYALKVIVSVQRNSFGVYMKFYVRRLFDASDQVTRHCFGQPVRSNEHIDSFGRLRQKDRRLTSRVAPAYDNYFFTATQLRFQMRGPVIDASTLKLRKVFQLQSSILGARSDHHRACGNAVSFANQQSVGSAITSKTFRVLCNQHLRPKLLRLRVGAAGKLM